MSNKKITSLILLAALASVTLASCASDNSTKTDTGKTVIPLSENIEVTHYPSWGAGGAKVLSDAGWNVALNEANPQLSNVKNFPKYYTATNPKNGCSFDLGITSQYLNLIKNKDEEYETRKYMLFSIDAQNPTKAEETTTNINISDTNNTLALLTIPYSYDNKVFTVSDTPIPTLVAGEAPPETATDASFTIDGKVNVIQASRVLSSSNANPFYVKNPIMEAEGRELPPDYIGVEARPVINVNYKCIDTELDMKLWDKVISASSLSLPIKK